MYLIYFILFTIIRLIDFEYIIYSRLKPRKAPNSNVFFFFFMKGGGCDRTDGHRITTDNDRLRRLMCARVNRVCGGICRDERFTRCFSYEKTKTVSVDANPGGELMGIFTHFYRYAPNIERIRMKSQNHNAYRYGGTYWLLIVNM